MTNKIHKKLVVFDINIDWKDSNDSKKHQDIDALFSVLKVAQEKQKVIIQTNGCLKDSLIFLEKNNINPSYLIASGGAIIYDYLNKKIINCNILPKSDAATIIHHAIMNAVNVAIFTKDEKFLYVENNVAYDGIKDYCFTNYTIINSYSKLNEIIKNNDIVDVGLFLFNDFVNNSRQKKIIDNINKFWENELQTLSMKTNKTSKFVHYGTIDSTKSNAINKIMSLENIKNNDDILYIACTCVDRQCLENFNNILLSSTVDFINEIADFSGFYVKDKISSLDLDFGSKTGKFWK